MKFENKLHSKNMCSYRTEIGKTQHTANSGFKLLAS